MNWLTKIIVYLKWKKVDVATINRWIEEGNVELLSFTLDHGFYKERIGAIRALTKLRAKALLPKLLTVAKKDIEVVAKEAIEAIKIIDSSSAFQDQLNALEKYWAIRNSPSSSDPSKRKVEWLNKKEKMKMLERVREQLKTRMR
ncbi:HEAT repeat domain-containing protein [Neolewinella lacunae]|uniref:HEAT repeat domain-containing protein n=1 Tax=Neolewinella lacunae TaxID=1517758 RepID=A0A923PGT4_9BACT|nr:HEAT repeat domain-containing protein [Neolewinella lacunae]MBC6993797.1 HEAT repeat domain-containing protein [Neolewinella lacunae]MDN3635312.1 HEAT repeat domain-containing protein [Neolewinella lacunae]